MIQPPPASASAHSTAMPVPTAPQPSKSQPPQKAKMERDPRPAAYTPFAVEDPARMENTAEATMENSSSKPPVTQATKSQKRKGDQNAALGKLAKARIDAKKVEKQEQQEELHLIDSAWPSDWISAPVTPD